MRRKSGTRAHTVLLVVVVVAIEATRTKPRNSAHSRGTAATVRLELSRQHGRAGENSLTSSQSTNDEPSGTFFA